jgi:hypothetical protein
MSFGLLADEKKSYFGALSSLLRIMTERRIVRDDLRQSKPCRRRLPEGLPLPKNEMRAWPMVLEQSI